MKALLQIFNYGIKNSDNGTVDIYIDGDIVDSPTQQFMKDYWGDDTSVSFRSFRNQISDANPKVLNVHTNSGGGHVGDAMAMHDYLADLENKGVTVNRMGTGIVASAATYLVMGKNSSMSPNGMFMIHNVSMLVYGDIVQCENQVKVGRKFNNMIRDFYASKTGLAPETISGWMNKETWFTAQEAKDNGFVENISGEDVALKNKINPENWPFSNMAVLNKYNSLFNNQNQEDMDLKKVGEGLENAFKKVFGNSKVSGLPENAAKDFSTEVMNVLKGEILDKDAIKKIVNEELEATAEADAEELKNVFVEKAEMENLQKEIVKNLGGKSNTTEDKSKESGSKSNKGSKTSRFANKTFFTDKNA